MKVGIVGLPNAGKSTLIRAVSAARPKVADYPFTTLNPSLGVVRVAPEASFVIADIPGLIEGAAEGAGLGHQFLRHLARTRLLLHVVDSSSPGRAREAGDVDKVLAEIGADGIPQLAVWNKVDASGLEPGVQHDEYGRISRVLVSAHTGAGLAGLRGAIAEAAQLRRQTGHSKTTIPELSM